MSVDLKSDMKDRRRSRRQRDRLIGFLSKPLLLEEVGPPQAFSQVLMVVSLLIGGALLLAALTEVRETAAVQGQIIPAGRVNIVQHLEGGIVEEILVEDGQVVVREEPVMRLQAASVLPELEQMRAREAALALKSERLRASPRPMCMPNNGKNAINASTAAA